MRVSLGHLPKNKRNELARIVERIRKRVDSIQMIILFDSYARGNWVDDTCTKGHITYEYISDFDVFPQGTKQEKNCFDLLNRAYVEARYDPDYKITRKQLEYLSKRVKLLQRLTKRICKEKIESFT